MKEMKEKRKQMLLAMDYYVRNIIGDEEITCYIWLAGGLPDGYDKYDLEYISEDDEAFYDCVNCFTRCLKRSL